MDETVDKGMCFVAEHPGIDGYYAAIKDAPGRQGILEKFILRCIADGAIVSCVPYRDAVEGLRRYPECRGKPAS